MHIQKRWEAIHYWRQQGAHLENRLLSGRNFWERWSTTPIKKAYRQTCVKMSKYFIKIDFCAIAQQHCIVFFFAATLPRNCDDVLTSGNAEPGTYLVDVDGSGPLLETYVYCRNGQTIVPHNMPNGTLIRSKDLGDLRFRVNYRSSCR